MMQEEYPKANPNGTKKLGLDVLSVVVVVICGAFLICVIKTLIDTSYEIPLVVTIAVSGLVGWLFKSYNNKKGNGD